MIRATSLALLALVASCGDNVFGATPDLPGPALAPGADLVVIAHQDDDLLFMQPDVIEAVQRGGGVTNVYVTAGNANKGVLAADIRYEGLKQAYGAAAGSFDWACGYIEINGQIAQHCRLEPQHVSLVFLAYPDGLVRGESPTSLLNLWEGNVDNVETIAPLVATYSREILLDTLAEIVRQTQPAIVHTLEIAGTHGADEHADHMVVGAATLLALGRVDAHPALLSYRGYNTTTEPINKIPPIFDVVRPFLVRYEACATGCAPCGQACTTILSSHDDYLARRYATGFRRHARGILRSGGQCLLGGGGLGDCASAPVWTISNGTLATGGMCLAFAADGGLAMATCDGSVAQRLALDDEGHIWSAVPPAPQPNMDYAHVDCLTPGTAAVTAALCGVDSAPAWDVLPALVTSTPALDLTGHLAIGDLTGDGLGDACAIVAGELVCAPGDGAGGFGAIIQITALAVDPASLAIGDVDGDGRPDACGRADVGTVCALAASGFAASTLAPTFGASDARADTATSIAVVDQAVCGAAAAGATCAPRSLRFTDPSELLSPWPDPASMLWPGDLDGDGNPDWCTTTATGVACGVSAESTITTDGVPWLYSTETVPDGTLAQLADVDGDGLADLCNIAGFDVTCAHSQGRAFGPQATLLEAPVAPTAVWLGDLDGDGIADACVAVNGTLACTVSR